MSKLMRTWRFFAKQLHLVCVRICHPSVKIGVGCDIRARFALRVDAKAHVRIGQRCIIDNDMVMEIAGHFEVGARTIFGHHCTIAAKESVLIGEDCLIAEMVSIRDHDHTYRRMDIPVREQGATCAPVKIGRDVWIGAKATITKGVVIGDHAIIGANAVVTKNIPENAVAVGVPAKVIKRRT